MSEIINWPEMEANHRRDLMCWFIIETMTRRAHVVDGHGDITKSFPDLDVTKLEVVMTINGVEVPVVETFKKAEAQFDAIVAKKAAEMVRTALNDGVDKFNQIVDATLRDFEEKLGVSNEDF